MFGVGDVFGMVVVVVVVGEFGIFCSDNAKYTALRNLSLRIGLSITSKNNPSSSTWPNFE